MANDKSAKPAEAPAEGGTEKPKKNSMAKMAIMAVLVLVLEGGTVVGTMMMTSGPRKAVAESPLKAAEPEPKDVEVDLMKEDTLPNKVGGKPFLYTMQIVAKVSEKNKDKAKELFTSHDAETRDHIRTIVASTSQKTMDEPGLETLRRQIAYELEQDLGKDGKDLVKEILIPKCTGREIPQY